MKLKQAFLCLLLLTLSACSSSSTSSSSLSNSSSTSSSTSGDSSTSSLEPPIDPLPDDEEGGGEEEKPKSVNRPVFELKFKNIDGNLYKNTGTIEGDPTLYGEQSYVTDTQYKSNGILKFNGLNRGTDYLLLPNSILDSDKVSISSWVHLPNDFASVNNNSTLFGFTDGSKYFYCSPYDTDSWFGYSIITNLNGPAKNLTKVPPSPNTYWQNTPVDGTLQSVAGAWHLIGFVFTQNSLEVYQNGHLMLSYTGQYSLKNLNITEFKIGSFSKPNSLDFNGSISDFRIYHDNLGELEWKKEYNLSNHDFLTTDFEFESDFVDSVRGLQATPNGNAQIVNKDGKNSVHLDGSGFGGPSNQRTSLTLPTQTIIGHNEITISTDIYLIDSKDLYQRVFEFTIKGARYFAMYVGFGAVNNLKVEYVPDSTKERDVVLDTTYTVPTGRWINITFTAGKNVGSLYVDGQLIDRNENFKFNPVILYYWPDVTATIGRTDFYNDKPLSAYIDNFKMYNYAMSDMEVKIDNNIIHETDDKIAVNNEIQKFSLSKEHALKYVIPKEVGEGVTLSFESLNKSIVDNNGFIYPLENATTCDIKLKFSRGNYWKITYRRLNIEARNAISTDIIDSGLENVTYHEDSYFDEAMLANIDYMFSLDCERLLYNYRLNAGLPTNGAVSYGGWIGTQTGGAGQFESQYVGALARYCLSKPDYVSPFASKDTNTPLKRLTYLLTEIRKCQVAYGEKYPEQKGYLSAFTHLCMEAIENGSSTVSGGDGIHGQVPIGGVNAWVPFYMYHKNVMMCYDTYIYCPDQTIKDLAKTMLIDACDWLYNEIEPLSPTQRSNVLNVEYGGISEALYLTYALVGNPNYLKVARFFEQESLLKSIHDGINVMGGIHANTFIPKMLAVCAAYQVTGDIYYKEVALNAWDMIVYSMTYPNGGVSIDEHFEKPGIVSQGLYGEETCCSYNMLIFTNYLFKWTGEVKYAHYFENVFYNHIMGSMDFETGGKTYPVSTTFGYYKIYSSAFDAFWCCCCTGQESFSKLTYGNFYKDNDSIIVNMFNPASYSVSDNETLSIEGNLIQDEKVNIKTNFASSRTLKIRHPQWTTPVFKVNNSVINPKEENGYYFIDVQAGATQIDVSLPMSYRLEEEKGYETNHALFYGPYMLVANLGECSHYEQISASQTKDGTYGGPYTGSLTQFVYLADGKENISKHISKTNSGKSAKFTLEADNQTVEFIPFMDAQHVRYSMFMAYESGSSDYFNIDKEKKNISMEAVSFDAYKSSGTSTVSYQDNSATFNGGEQKLIAKNVNIATDEFEVGLRVTAVGNNEVNTGLYLGASGAGNGQDQIKSTNVHLEKAQNSNVWKVSIYSFNQAYLGCLQQFSIYNASDSVDLRVVYKNGKLYVFVNSEYPVISMSIEANQLYGQIGIRNQGKSVATVSNFYYAA